MKIACLILAYANPHALAASLPVYDAAGWDVFVHLDSKVVIDTYRGHLGPSSSLCRFIEPRTLVFWGGYSMITAQLRLIEAAMQAGNYDKFVLLSDDSMPLFPPSYLNEVLASKEDLITALHESSGTKTNIAYHNYYFYDHPATTVRGFRTVESTLIDTALEEAVAEIAALRKIGKKQVKLASGWQFWSLSLASVQIILRAIASDSHLVKSFQYSRLPDETMFQTILFEAKYPRGIRASLMINDLHTHVGTTRVFNSIASLPFELDGCQIFMRKIAADGKLLNAIAQRLLSGKAAWGYAPETLRLGMPVMDENGQELALTTFRLAAPGKSTGPHKTWHGVETFCQQEFRWTAKSELSWTLPEINVPPGQIRFFIPMLMHRFRSPWKAYLRFNNETKPLQVTRQSLVAEFTHDGLSGQPEVTLMTPETVAAAPPRDMRKIGLAIGV